MTTASSERYQSSLVNFIQKAETPDEAKQRAAAWYDKQLRVLALCHGSSWTDHQPFVEGYLKVELRNALVECGWRKKS